MTISPRRYMGRYPREAPSAKDHSQKPRWHTCRCVKALPDCGTYFGWRRCRGCGHLMGEWSTALLPLAPPKHGPFHVRAA